MDGQGRRSKAQQRRNSGRTGRRHRNSRRHGQVSQSRDNSAINYAQSSNNSNLAVPAASNESDRKEIPGYYFDPMKNRYFKTSQHHPGKPLVCDQGKAVPKKSHNECFKGIPESSRLHHFREREITHNPVVSERRGLEEWARHVVEKKRLTLRNDISNIALSPSCHKMIAVSRLHRMRCDPIHETELYNVNHDKEDFVSPQMFATTVSSEVSHVEWNPNENMENFFLLSLLGSERSTGSGVICKFNDSSAPCELNSFPLSRGTAWHCSWCQYPQYSNLVGIAGSKETELIDAEKKVLLHRIGSSSDVFCVEFARKTPVIFLGCRSGEIVRIDIRANLKPQTCIGKKQHSSMTCIKMMEDENYLMASNYDGTIKMWDIRLSKPVKEYHGNVNETKLIPFVMDSSQSIIASAGQDGRTRIWSVGSCKLLNIIDRHDTTNCENPAFVPPVCLGEKWGNKGGMVAFGVASSDQLYFYY